jgi:hypothetical protein
MHSYRQIWSSPTQMLLQCSSPVQVSERLAPLEAVLNGIVPGIHATVLAVSKRMTLDAPMLQESLFLYFDVDDSGVIDKPEFDAGVTAMQAITTDAGVLMRLINGDDSSDDVSTLTAEELVEELAGDGDGVHGGCLPGNEACYAWIHKHVSLPVCPSDWMYACRTACPEECQPVCASDWMHACPTACPEACPYECMCMCMCVGVYTTAWECICH